MQELMNLPIDVHHSDDSDLQALELFKNLGVELQNDQQEPFKEPSYEYAEDHDDSAPKLSRLSKLKKQSKKEKKKNKLKEKNRDKKKHKLHRDDMQVSPGPRKKVKRQGSTKRKSHNDDDIDKLDKDDRGSSQFDSVSDNESDLNNELLNLNPDLAQENGQSPKKRLIKSGRKEKIQDKQGFKLQQLGVEGAINYSDDESYSGDRKRKRKNKKDKIKVPTNEQIMNAFKDHGVVESEDSQSGDRNYDRGLDMLNSLKSKSKNSIRVNNRLFGDLEMKLQKEQQQVKMPQDLQLQLGPKISSSSHRNSFLNKAQNIKKQRGLQAEVNHQQFERKAQQKAKKSIARIVSSMVSQDFHDDLDLQIKAPSITRGRSADIINNTVFLRQTLDKIEDNEEAKQIEAFALKQTKSMTYNTSLNIIKRESISRQQLFKQIQDQTRMRRSKYISNDELKNSFKKTNLEELQQARKKIMEKKRKQAFSDDGDSESDYKVDSEMNEMIQKQEKVCGDIQEDQENQQELEKEENVEQKAQQDKQQSPEEQQLMRSINNGDQIDEAENSELNQFKNLMEEEASQSIQEQKDHQEQNEQDEEFVNDINGEPRPSQQENASEHHNLESEGKEDKKQEEIIAQAIAQNSEREKQMQELEDEGIIVRKRRRQDKILERQQANVDMGEYLIEAPVENQQMKDEKAEPEQINEEVAVMKNIDTETNNEEFSNFKKLRKIAQVIARKKQERQIGRQYASQFIEHQAEEGSDNEDHDEIVKNINYEAEDKQYEGIDLDADLVELIDNAVDLNQEDEFEAFRKYLEDVRIKDRQQIRKIVRGQFWKKHEDLELQIEEDERLRQERMEKAMQWMKQRQQQQGEGIYLKSPERENDSDQDSEYVRNKKNKKDEEQGDESQDQIPAEQEMAKLNRFLEETLPSVKKEYKPLTSELNFQPLPESFKMEKKPSNQKTISMSKFGSNIRSGINSLQILSRKNTSSLVNQILSKNHKAPKKLVQHDVFKKSGKK